MDGALADRDQNRRRRPLAGHDTRHAYEGEIMLPPELRRMLVRIAGNRAPGPIEIAAALVGSWTHNELLTFGFRRTPDGRWLAPAGWRTA